MNAQFSPGPWAAKPQRLLRAVPITSAAGLVATTSNAGDPQQIAANARLLAAAPEMLAMLQRLVAAESRMDGNNPIAGLCDEARDIIHRVRNGGAA